ncbi:MAG: hypothetical protein AB7I48_19695 [Planctomycetaceae bacterium]
MQDRQLYEQILGIASPWFVERVELNVAVQSVKLALRDSVESVREGAGMRSSSGRTFVRGGWARIGWSI